jgi:predicted aspartyl protease
MKLTGKFNNNRILLSLRIECPNALSQQEDCEGIIDTGFNGFVMLPESIFIGLGFENESMATVTLANKEDHQALSAIGSVYIGDISVSGIILSIAGCFTNLFWYGSVRCWKFETDHQF